MPYFIAAPINVGKYLDIVKPPYRPIPVSKQHLTLLYLGGLSETALETAKKAVGNAIQGLRPITVKFMGARPYPSYARPRYVCAEVVEGVHRLAKARRHILTCLLDSGIKPKDRFLDEFKPHVAFCEARVKPSQELYRVLEKMIRSADKISIGTLIRRICLYESREGEYVVKNQYSLGLNFL